MKQFFTAICRRVQVNIHARGGPATYHVRVSRLIEHLDIVETDVQEPLLGSDLGLRRARVTPTHWSTDLSVPVMERSFLSSTVTLWSVSVLKSEKMS